MLLAIKKIPLKMRCYFTLKGPTPQHVTRLALEGAGPSHSAHCWEECRQLSLLPRSSEATEQSLSKVNTYTPNDPAMPLTQEREEHGNVLGSTGHNFLKGEGERGKKTWKLKCPSMGERMKKLGCFHTVKHWKADKINQYWQHAI